MLIFSVSDKGGTGRSVTSTNLSYRAALLGYDTCYLDFDFGSPTVGAIFDVEPAARGVQREGLHDYLGGRAASSNRIDVWTESSREVLRRPPGAGALTLLPGSRGGAEFTVTASIVDRCTDLFTRLDEEFDLCVVDLSAGRSFATELVLLATERAALRSVTTRWLVFHKWTRQHIIAAHGLVYDERGLFKSAATTGHDEDAMRAALRFVRTAVINPHASDVQLMRPSQQAWLFEVDQDLERLAARMELGRAVRIGSIPLDPVLQWREQLITDRDVHTTEIANPATAEAFEALARAVTDPTPWEGF